MMHNKKRRTQGYSLIEVMITISLLAVVMLVATQALVSSTGLFESSAKLSRVDRSAEQVMEQMTNELIEADLATLLITTTGDGSNAIQFNIPETVVGETVTWSTDIVYTYANSGVDTNLNGNSNDDGMITRTQGGGSAEIIARSIQPGGMIITQTGNNITIQITVEAGDGNGGILERTFRTSVTLKNSSL